MDAEKALNTVFGEKYTIQLDHQILADCRVFHPQATELVFELTLASPSQVVKGLDASKLQYETIRSKTLADEATSAYSSGKESTFDNVMREEVVTFVKNTDSRLKHQGESSAPIAQGNPFALH